MNFGVDTDKNSWELHDEGQRYNAEVKALIDAGIHSKLQIRLRNYPIHRL